MINHHVASNNCYFWNNPIFKQTNPHVLPVPGQASLSRWKVAWTAGEIRLERDSVSIDTHIIHTCVTLNMYIYIYIILYYSIIIYIYYYISRWYCITIYYQFSTLLTGKTQTETPSIWFSSHGNDDIGGPIKHPINRVSAGHHQLAMANHARNHASRNQKISGFMIHQGIS